jgi:hypothetical protein
LFRATPAHRILAFRAFPTQPAATSLDAHCSLAVQSAPTFAGCPARAIAPTSVLFAEPTPRLSIFLPRYPCDHRTGADISHAAHRRTSKPNHERPTPALKRRRRTLQAGINKLGFGPAKHPRGRRHVHVFCSREVPWLAQKAASRVCLRRCLRILTNTHALQRPDRDPFVLFPGHTLASCTRDTRCISFRRAPYIPDESTDPCPDQQS